MHFQWQAVGKVYHATEEIQLSSAQQLVHRAFAFGISTTLLSQSGPASFYPATSGTVLDPQFPLMHLIVIPCAPEIKQLPPSHLGVYFRNKDIQNNQLTPVER